MVLKKLKGLRGIFYRKLVEAAKKKEKVTLPGFVIKKPIGLVELPKIKDIRKADITYPLIEPFAYANIKWDEARNELIYNLIEPELSAKEKELLKRISDALIEIMEIGLTAIKDSYRITEYLEKQVKKIIDNLGLTLTPDQYVKIMYHITRNFVGYNEIEPLLQDPHIEDISCDGLDVPVYVVHRKFGTMKTNIIYRDLDSLRNFVVKLAERCGRYVSYAEPILDGTLPDGSRVSATLAGDVATRGPTFTIRKFGEKPYSPIDQIELGTVSAEMLAYLWFLIENGISMLIVGGTATGKTSFLNSICMFIPMDAKIVSIEDTREIRIPHEHWIPGLTRVGFGIPMPTGEKYGEVSLFDLLRESFRQNPDYVLVGETRGKEAYVMFQGMASGHASLSTFHAGSVDTVIKRLTTPPIELSPTLIESLDLVAIMVFAREKGKSARRVKEIIEIESVDPKTEEVKMRVIFRWNPVTDGFDKVGDSIKIRNIITAKGGRIEDALADIKRRKEVLEWLRREGKKDYLEVTEIINMFYRNPEKLFQIMKKKVPPKVLEKVVKRRPLRKSILELLGFKILEEE